MSKIYRNMVAITSVRCDKKTQFAFGQILEDEPRTVFFPHWLIKAYGITKDDCGYEFDCLFIHQSGDRGPMAIYVIDEEIGTKASELVGEYSGRPGTDDFNAKVTILNNGSV